MTNKPGSVYRYSEKGQFLAALRRIGGRSYGVSLWHAASMSTIVACIAQVVSTPTGLQIIMKELSLIQRR